ncbi:MAG TPA: winged helix-turn-helix domain-containing protein [Thermomicrobiales bacterium]|nr:winged helix-turn-helix domain-containing protein [Thermomicrobiales bacterium]HRA46472.1 winged helix-turn-helix domain-containing protein [Thermomicrobiales bacterium]
MNEFLAELFSSKVRAAVLGQMLLRPQIAVSLTELSRLLGLPISSLQHECYKLERIGLIKGRREGNSRRYRVQTACPVLPELTALVVAAIGEQGALAATLADVPGIDAAFLGAELPLSADRSVGEPVPVVLIGEIPLEEIDGAVDRVARILRQPIAQLEAVFYLPEDWQARLAQQSHYAVSLMAGPRTNLVGDPARISSEPAS